MFYEEYFRQDIVTATEFKIKYLQSLLDCIYKSIAFDNNDMNE